MSRETRLIDGLASRCGQDLPRSSSDRSRSHRPGPAGAAERLVIGWTKRSDPSRLRLEKCGHGPLAQPITPARASRSGPNLPRVVEGWTCLFAGGLQHKEHRLPPIWEGWTCLAGTSTTAQGHPPLPLFGPSFRSTLSYSSHTRGHGPLRDFFYGSREPKNFLSENGADHGSNR